MEPGITPGIHRLIFALHQGHLVHFNGARDYSRDATSAAAENMYQVYKLQWSLGLLPGCNSHMVDWEQVVLRASMEPGTTPRIHRCPRSTLWQTRSFNGARDHSRDTLDNEHKGVGGGDPSMEPGITPGIHDFPSPCGQALCSFNGARDYSRDTPTPLDIPCKHEGASMEPGITPGIHCGAGATWP